MGILKDIGDAAGAAVDKVQDVAGAAVDTVQDALGMGDNDEKGGIGADLSAEVAQTTDGAATAMATEPIMASAEAAVNTYTVESGDSLSKIAAKYGTTWQKIFEANRDKINDPDLIHPGQELVIPE